MQNVVKRAVLSHQINHLKKKPNPKPTKKTGETEENCEIYMIWPFVKQLCPSIAVLLWKGLCYFALLLVSGQVGFEGWFLDVHLPPGLEQSCKTKGDK